MSSVVKIRLALGFCSLLFLSTSCGNSDKKHSTTAGDSTYETATPRAKASMGTDIQQVFKSPGLSHWQTRMKKAYPHFSARHFQQAKKNPLSRSGTQPFSEEKWQVFQPYFIPGPAKKKAIDLYSYGHLPGDSGGQLEPGSPDNEVNLVDLTEKTKTRLLYAGPGTDFQHAEWLNDSIIIVTGESDANEENEMKPVVWTINIQSGVVAEYFYQDTAATDSSPLVPGDTGSGESPH